MGFSFTLTSDDRAVAGSTDAADEIAGEDISLAAGDMTETASGDLSTVTGVDCARQSVIREIPATPGSFPRRPQWGAGVGASLFKSATPSLRDRLISQIRARMDANPRIVKTYEVSGQALDTPNSSVAYSIRADAVGGPISEDVLVKPPGVF